MSRAFRERLAYSAYFVEGISGFADLGRVFARSAGGGAIGVELRVDAGRVVFIPYVRDLAPGANRHPVASSIVDCLRRLQGQAVEESPPGWVMEFTLPGLADLAAKHAAAEEELQAARAKADEARARLGEIDRYRQLLWQEGKFGLEAISRQAFAALGYQVSDDLDQPCVLFNAGERVLVEVEGSPAAAGMEAHYRLRRRMEEAISEGRPHKGVALVNGWRLNPPATRETQYVDALRIAAESMRYCLLTTSQLFEVLRRHMEGDKSVSSAFWQRLMSCEGVFDLDSLSTGQ